MNSSQMTAFFGTGLAAHRIFPEISMEEPKVIFGLRSNHWVNLHVNSLLAIAAHTEGGNFFPLDEASRGVRVALGAASGFRLGEVPLFNLPSERFEDTFRSILREGWYTRWEEWWHCKDILAVTPKPFGPNRLDTASPIWLAVITDLAEAFTRSKGPKI